MSAFEQPIFLMCEKIMIAPLSSSTGIPILLSILGPRFVALIIFITKIG
jgi:hypothetical protein